MSDLRVWFVVIPIRHLVRSKRRRFWFGVDLASS